MFYAVDRVKRGTHKLVLMNEPYVKTSHRENVSYFKDSDDKTQFASGGKGKRIIIVRNGTLSDNKRIYSSYVQQYTAWRQFEWVPAVFVGEYLCVWFVMTKKCVLYQFERAMRQAGGMRLGESVTGKSVL